MQQDDTAVRPLPLAQRHAEYGARFAPFAGYSMPMQYTGILEEHHAVRTSVGLFDVSHMGELRITGRRALEAVNTLVTADLRDTAVGQARYGLLCHPDGGIVDDLLIYKMGASDYLLCVNASNRAKDLAFIQAHLIDGATVADESDAWVQLAVQGPDATEILQPLSVVDLDDIAYYHFEEGQLAGVRCLISRTGYTGEDGFEIYIPTDQAEGVFDRILSTGKPMGMALCGLGARDTLRLEARMPLYGNDLTDATNPLEAGLGWAVKWDKPEPFIGRDALAAIKAQGVTRRLRGVKLRERGVPRAGYGLRVGGEEVGQLTSGTHSPTLGVGIGMGYVAVQHAEAPQVDVIIRDKAVPADLMKKPFYQR